MHDELMHEFVNESREHLATIETDLLAIEEAGADSDIALLNKVFRAAHSIKGAAGFFDLNQVKDLAHGAETILDLLRSRQIAPNAEITNVLLRAFDKLRDLVNQPSESNLADISTELEALHRLADSTSQTLKTSIAQPQVPVVDVASPDVPNAASLAVSSSSSGPAPSEETLRVNVTLLDGLMNLAGELVLSRNHFQAAIARKNFRMLTSAGQRLSQVTSEIQDAIMRTRLQPIDGVLSRLPRVVRDLSQSLGKDVRLDLIGREVALDRSLLEGLSDPLTHMVRNAVDHGIESPEIRVRNGKPRQGSLRVEARHEAGQVVIEIADDGSGIDHQKVARAACAKGLISDEQLRNMTADEQAALIMLPGLSTAEKVTQVSGRGVGMDVVKTNLDRLGGQVEIISRKDEGTTFRIKLPLTLTIIPALILSAAGERFAIPQANVEELLRVRAQDVRRRIEVVGGTQVLVLRDCILPLLSLPEFLRETESIDGNSESVAEPSTFLAFENALEIAVITTGTFRYALVVESFQNTEEIVVKPLGRDLKQSREYAGATILGDGTVALILDAAGLASQADLSSPSKGIGAGRQAQAAESGANLQSAMHSLLLFRNAPGERCAVPLEQVRRIERVKSHQIENCGSRRTMQYRDRLLPLIALSDVAPVEGIGEPQDLAVIVSSLYGHEFGLLATLPLDVYETDVPIDTSTHRQAGIAGSMIVRDETTLLVDLMGLIESAYPEWIGTAQSIPSPVGASTVLLAEDSDFFRAQVKRFLEGDGHRVIDAPDGQAAWELLLNNRNAVQMLVTDIEMPRMNGLELAARVRADERTNKLPIIAISSLAGDEDVARAKAAGVTEYQIKLDRDSLLSQVRQLLMDVHANVSTVLQ